MVAPFLPDAEKLAAIRGALPALGAGIYLNTGSVGPMPSETAAAMAELVEYELRVGRAHPADWERFLERMAEARAAVAAVIGADVDEIALTHSTSQAMNAAIWSVDIRPGDRIVTTQAEHPGALGPVHVVAERFGAEVAIADVGDGGDDERTLAAFDAAITDRTRVVALSHVLYTTGGRLPVREIAELAHRNGARVVVDGAQSVGAMPVSVADLGIDFYAVPGQKWLLGPEGTGALWASPAILEGSRASSASWFTFDRIGPSEAVLRPDARRFDDAGHYRPAVTGFARSCGWLSMYIGLPWVHARGLAVARAAADRLAGIPGVELVTPRERMATLVTFRIAGWTPDEALEELGGRAFVIARTIPDLAALRLSVGFFTTDEEIERVAASASDDPGPGGRLMPAPPSEVRRRSELEIRWRQFRNAPRPVVRAVLSSLVVAIVLGLGYLVYDVALRRGAVLPGGDLRTLYLVLDVVVVLVVGSVVTWLVVPQPRGSGTVIRRSPWSAALGLFAAVPVCYLVLVVVVQVLEPLLG